MRRRAELLWELLSFKRPAGEIVRDLAPFGWDSDEELVVLTPGHLGAVLERFVAGTLTADDTSSWAEAIEGRDDIGLQKGFEPLLKQLLFELANPDITEELTLRRAETLIRDLR
jgi:hypothetical protein